MRLPIFYSFDIFCCLIKRNVNWCSLQCIHFSLLEESLKYITLVSRTLENDIQETTVKYLRVLLHKVYLIVEKVRRNPLHKTYEKSKSETIYYIFAFPILTYFIR